MKAVCRTSRLSFDVSQKHVQGIRQDITLTTKINNGSLFLSLGIF